MRFQGERVRQLLLFGKEVHLIVVQQPFDIRRLQESGIL